MVYVILGSLTCLLCTGTAWLQIRILQNMREHEKHHKILAAMELEHVALHEQLHGAAHKHIGPLPRNINA